MQHLNLRVAAPVALLLLVLALMPSISGAQEDACEGRFPCPAFQLTGGYTADFRSNLHGGMEQGMAASGLLELGAAWTTDRLLPGAWVTTSASLIHTGGGAISAHYVGDLQGLNNIEAPTGLRLYELWSEIRFGSGAISTRVGYLDLNAEFDAPVTSAFFIGPPFGIGTDLAQTGENGPAVFPVTSLGLRVAGQINESLQWRLAAFDGVPGQVGRDSFAVVDASRSQGALLIGELEYVPRGFNKLAAGVWSYTASFEPIDAAAIGDDTQHKGNHGAYATADLPVGSMAGTRFDAMFRIGTAAARYNAISRYAGAALVASHLSASRPDDAIGIAIAHGRTGQEFRDAMRFDGGTPKNSETQVELTWRALLRPWLALVPSLQWIDNPGADHALRNAWVVGLRFETAFDRVWPLLARQASPSSDAPLAMTAP